MSSKVVLRPGRTSLAGWRGVFRGEPVELDPVAQVDVEAGRAALSAIAGEDAATSERSDASPSLAELIEARGDILPEATLRLLLALKLTSLAQGAAGVRWQMVETLADLLANGLLPVVPEAADDRMALSHVFAALTGTGEILHRGRIAPATDLLRDKEIAPMALQPGERAMLLSGAAPSLALALASLFEAEHILHAAIAALALAAEARGEATLHPVVHRLNRQRGQMEVAAALRALTHRKSETPPDAALKAGNDNAHIAGADAVFRIGAALDLLRQAGALLERAANSVSEDRLVIWQTQETVAGTCDRTGTALAADLIAMSLAALGDALASGVAADDTASAASARALAEANRERLGTPALAPETIGRVRPMLADAAEIVATAVLAAVQAHESAGEGALAEVRRLVAENAPSDAEDEKARNGLSTLVRRGGLADALMTVLPSVAPAPGRASGSR